MTHQEQIKAIEMDLNGKLFRRDWHGVMDCAADLRELEAKERGRLEGYNDGIMAGLKIASYGPPVSNE
jgi:hypothetical protein